jgi:hypothetical protein
MNIPDPTAKCLEVGLNSFRMRLLRLLHDATDENSDDSVPRHRREKFRAAVQFHREVAEDWFERACRSFGATDGTWATVKEEHRAKMLRYLGRKNAEFENQCEFELDLLHVDLAESRDKELDAAFSVASK